MAVDNGKGIKGFAGLTDLASEVSDINGSINPEQMVEANPSTPRESSQPRREAVSSKSDRKTTSSPPPIKTSGTFKSGGGSGGKWILGIIAAIFVIWLMNAGGQGNNRSSYSPSSSSQSYSYLQSTQGPETQMSSTTQGGGLQYTRPSVGTDNVLPVTEIRWCIRERIRIEAMRDVINTNAGIDKLNRFVDDYNSRCGSYRYRDSSHSQAKREVETYRSQIVAEAIREASQLDRSYQSSYPSASSSASTSSALKKPDAQLTREAQQLLTDLGYDPGPIDGDYGRRTADAVKAFQHTAGIDQDGWIDEDLLSTLRKAKAAFKPAVPSQPKPQTRASSKSLKKVAASPGMPANAHRDYTGRKWECDPGYKQRGSECVSIFKQ